MEKFWWIDFFFKLGYVFYNNFKVNEKIYIFLEIIIVLMISIIVFKNI